MTTIHAHLLKALAAREHAEREHLAALRRAAELAAIQANLDADVAAVATLAPSPPDPRAPKGKP